MNDAIQQRVERFVQEILSLLAQACDESRSAALHVVSTLVKDTELPAGPPARARPRQRRSAAKTVSGQTRRRREAMTEPGAPSAAGQNEAAHPAPRRGARSNVVPVVSSAIPADRSMATAISTATSDTAAAPASEREALVLGAVRSLARATAREVAERSGQPNGSVGVTLRALVARGQLAKTRSARGMEYSLVSGGSIRPFKRAKPASVAGAGSEAAAAPVVGSTIAVV